MGIPIEMIDQPHAAPETDEERFALIRAMVARRMSIKRAHQIAFEGLRAFCLTTLAILGWLYGLGWAQGMFLLFGPLSLTHDLTGITARRMVMMPLDLPALIKELNHLRLHIQILGLMSIFATAALGMMRSLEQAQL